MPDKLAELIESGVCGDAEDILDNIFSNYFSADEAEDCFKWIKREYDIDDDDDDDEYEDEDV